MLPLENPRLTGLTKAELSAFGDRPDLLKDAVIRELQAFGQVLAFDRRLNYGDEEVHALVEARVAAIEDEATRNAVKATYDLILTVIDGGVSIQRSDDELLYWLKTFKPVDE